MSEYGYQPRTTLTDGTIPPSIRIRNEHTHTLKDGWRLASTTVEITYSMGDMGTGEVQELLAAVQRQAHAIGQGEAEVRNAVTPEASR